MTADPAAVPTPPLGAGPTAGSGSPGTASDLDASRGAHGSMGTDIYATEVVAVGPLVEEFVKAGVLVLFGEQAPEELHDFSVLHRPTIQLEGPAVGDVVIIGDSEIPVLAVGDVVSGNLLQLGHLDLKADGKDTATMPGDVCVPEGTLPEVSVGQTIRIVRPTVAAVEERTST